MRGHTHTQQSQALHELRCTCGHTGLSLTMNVSTHGTHQLSCLIAPGTQLRQAAKCWQVRCKAWLGAMDRVKTKGLPTGHGQGEDKRSTYRLTLQANPPGRQENPAFPQAGAYFSDRLHSGDRGQGDGAGRALENTHTCRRAHTCAHTHSHTDAFAHTHKQSTLTLSNTHTRVHTLALSLLVMP